MIYLAAIALVALSHLIYRRGMNGCRVSTRLEKLAVFIAAIASVAAIAELGSFVASLFARGGEEFSGLLSRLLVYPCGLILFVLVVLFLFPRPILRDKQAEPISVDNGQRELEK